MGAVGWERSFAARAPVLGWPGLRGKGPPSFGPATLCSSPSGLCLTTVPLPPPSHHILGPTPQPSPNTRSQREEGRIPAAPLSGPREASVSLFICLMEPQALHRTELQGGGLDGTRR